MSETALKPDKRKSGKNNGIVKILVILLILVAFSSTAFSAPYIPPGKEPPKEPVVKAVPTKSTVLVNNKAAAFEAYNIGGNNYFKLRDLAFVLNGTQKQFEVTWDGARNAIIIQTGKKYTQVGGEMAVSGNTAARDAKPTASKIIIDGEKCDFIAYNIGGNNYFKLRDIAERINFGVTWDGATNTIGIDTSMDYASGNGSTNNSGNIKIKEGIISGPPGIKTDNFEDNSFWSLAVSPKNPDLIYIGSEGNGIFKSQDGGATWIWQRKGLLYFEHVLPSHPAYPEAHDTAIDPNNDNTAYMTMMEGPGPVTGVVASCTAGLYKTVDGGETWVRKVNGLKNSSVCSVAIDEANTSTVFIGVNGGMGSLTLDNANKALFEGGIYKSTDSGENWSFKKIPVPGSEYNDFPKIQIFNSNTIYASGECWDNPSKAVGLLKSADAGENWSVISPEGQYIEDFDVALSNSNTIYINIFPPNAEQKIYSGSPEGKKYGIYRSTDGGRTWTKTSAIAYGTLRISPHDEKTVLFSNRGKIYKSSDGLQTYHEVFSYEKEPDILITDIEFSRSDPDIVYAASEGLLVMKSTDGGETFIKKANLRKFMDDITGKGQSASGRNSAKGKQPVYEGKNPEQGASIVISLPFSETNTPYEMMPMGETINHPDPPNTGGHPGIDFMWNDSVDIIACIDGTVDKVEKTGSHNKWDVFVNTGDFYVGYTTLEKVDENIKVGAQVKAGRKIGESGNFGTHYMIHWELGKIKEHKRICPMAYFDEASRQRIVDIWANTNWPEMKKQFPNICNGYYRCNFCRENGY